MSVKYANQINNMYYANMDEQRIKYILAIRNKDVIPNLKEMIYNFTPELIMKSLETGLSIREIVEKEFSGDFSKYIGEMRDYQTLGTGFMYMSPRSILGDGVGLGKTAEVGGLLNFLKKKGELTRFIIAVETSAVGQTQFELMKFTGLNIISLPSTADKLRKAINKTDWDIIDGIVIKHSTLRSDVFSKWLSLNLDEHNKSTMFNTFFLDESSVIKNRDTKIFEYTENICNIVDRVHLMNATAFETSIIDIYNQMDMAYPELLPKQWRIEKEYCVFGKKAFWKRNKATGKAEINFARQMTGYKNQEKFKECLKLVYFGRSKKEVGKELEHKYIVYEVEPTTEQSLAISKGYKYTEVLNCPTHLEDVNIQLNRKEIPKLDRLISLIENEFSGEQIMIYCFHLDAQQVIKQELEAIGRNPIILNGETDDLERLKIITDFNTGKNDILITNIQKSLNLYNGDVCIFYSMVGNPARMEQIRGRIDRSVDDKIKTYVLLLYKGTGEYNFFTQIAKQRSKDSRDLTIDAKTAVDMFIDAMDLGN